MHQNKEILENPNSLTEYQSAFPAYSEQLKLQIASAQSERDRIQALLSEYIGDIITINKDRNAQSLKEAIWKLADALLTAFHLPNPTTHELFKNTMEINETGFSLISSCYTEGINRQNSLYRQEILKTEARVVKGRRRHDVNIYKLSTLISNYSKDKKRKCVDSVISKPIINNNNESGKPITNNNESEKDPPFKRIRRSTSNNAKEILVQLLTCNSFSNDDQLLYKKNEKISYDDLIVKYVTRKIKGHFH
ncbi:15107_t:CDS:2 [Cetraspora pellucida]|uniref:15107_t:CDS:1 n=1 Tax=Cetraspora pellucida TaxID=1433469 RepID=A0ACA9KH00_9GLOM|nr:15107_t:CDS:2 [Cetraspora pellucida]